MCERKAKRRKSRGGVGGANTAKECRAGPQEEARRKKGYISQGKRQFLLWGD